MADIILMPRLSDTMTEGVIAVWHKQVGDRVRKGDLLADIETDKATMELESYKEGVVLYLGGRKGDSIKVNSLLCIIGEVGENIRHLIPGDSRRAEIPTVAKTNKRAFISYAREDKAIVQRIAADLRNAGVDVWMDVMDIRPGAIWDREIEKALANCDAFLFFASSHSVESDSVMDEVHYAQEEKKKIVPLLIGNCKIPLKLIRLQRVDMMSSYQDGLELLIKTLLHHV